MRSKTRDVELTSLELLNIMPDKEIKTARILKLGKKIDLSRHQTESRIALLVKNKLLYKTKRGYYTTSKNEIHKNKNKRPVKVKNYGFIRRFFLVFIPKIFKAIW